MKKCKAKFVFNTMVANESHCILRMLESVYKYVDYWVIQDNGSTDGTQDLIKNFFAEKGIPGFLYEIPWSGCMGQNRDHTVQTCLKADHGCDWILRVDADEVLEVDDDFDWSIFDETSIQSFDVPAKSGVVNYYRCWLWNAKLPWKFKHDKRHECIMLDRDNIGEGFQRAQLPPSFRHRVIADGQTYANPFKYYVDALELEKDMILKKEMLTDQYHLWYLGKSYHDNVPSEHLPFGDIHNHELARRGLFYFERFLEVRHQFMSAGTIKYVDEMAYTGFLCMAHLYGVLGDLEKEIWVLQTAEMSCPRRNEHLKRLAWIFHRNKRFPDMLQVTTKMMEPQRTNPYPSLCVVLEDDAYHNTGTLAEGLHKLALECNQMK